MKTRHVLLALLHILFLSGCAPKSQKQLTQISTRIETVKYTVTQAKSTLAEVMEEVKILEAYGCVDVSGTPGCDVTALNTKLDSLSTHINAIDDDVNFIAQDLMVARQQVGADIAKYKTKVGRYRLAVLGAALILVLRLRNSYG